MIALRSSMTHVSYFAHNRLIVGGEEMKKLLPFRSLSEISCALEEVCT